VPIDELPPLRDVISKHGLQALKALGQNFLLDLNLTSRIARSAKNIAQSTILEIGPGPGGLTRALLAAGAKRVVCVERDERCLPALVEIEQHYPERLEIIHGDALAFDPLTLETDQPIKIISNLPYNIGTALLLKWIDTPYSHVSARSGRTHCRDAANTS